LEGYLCRGSDYVLMETSQLDASARARDRYTRNMACSAMIMAITTMINATRPCTGPLNTTLSPKEKFIASRIINFETKSMVQADRPRSIFALKPGFLAVSLPLNQVF